MKELKHLQTALIGSSSKLIRSDVIYVCSQVFISIFISSSPSSLLPFCYLLFCSPLTSSLSFAPLHQAKCFSCLLLSAAVRIAWVLAWAALCFNWTHKNPFLIFFLFNSSISNIRYLQPFNQIKKSQFSCSSIVIYKNQRECVI